MKIEWEKIEIEGSEQGQQYQKTIADLSDKELESLVKNGIADKFTKKLLKQILRSRKLKNLSK